MPSALTFEKQNILVTGGAGFLGSHLCESLLRDGHRVICLDNFSTGDVKNIDLLLQHPDFRFVRVDINQPFDLESMPDLAQFKLPFQGIQEIYHLACPTSIKKFDQFKIQTLLANSVGVAHVLDIAKKYRSRILLASSSVVYGKREGGDPDLHEDEYGVMDQLSDRSCYEEGKRFAETAFETYRQVHGLDIRIARIFRAYGPRMPLFDDRLIPDYILNALDGKDLVLSAGVNIHSPLCYVTDMIDGMQRLMRSSEYVGPVNLGSDVDVPLKKVAELIVSLTDSSSKIIEEGGNGNTELTLPDISRAKDLGWLPLVRLEDGLRRTIEYFKANRILLTSL